jgi:hypothetical protein
VLSSLQQNGNSKGFPDSKLSYSSPFIFLYLHLYFPQIARYFSKKQNPI